MTKVAAIRWPTWPQLDRKVAAIWIIYNFGRNYVTAEQISNNIELDESITGWKVVIVMEMEIYLERVRLCPYYFA